MPKAIGDSSTLIHLAAIGRLDLLYEFYDLLLITPAVWREVVEEGRGRSGALEIKKGVEEGRIKIQAPRDSSFLSLLKRELDDGEAEVIALAVENGTADVLLDESDARRVADVFKLVKTGIVGILIRAKLADKIPALRSELIRLRTEGGFWIEDRLIEQASRSIGEYDEG
jgi:hypothetical protein